MRHQESEVEGESISSPGYISLFSSVNPGGKSPTQKVPYFMKLKNLAAVFNSRLRAEMESASCERSSNESRRSRENRATRQVLNLKRSAAWMKSAKKLSSGSNIGVFYYVVKKRMKKKRERGEEKRKKKKKITPCVVGANRCSRLALNSLPGSRLREPRASLNSRANFGIASSCSSLMIPDTLSLMDLR